MLVNGEATPLTIARVNNSYKITSAELGLVLQIVSGDGSVVPLDADGNINAEEGDLVDVQVSGARPDDDINIWMFSTPIQIGQGSVSEDGTFTGRFGIPSDVDNGRHRLVLKTVSFTGSESTVTIGFIVGSGNNGNSAISAIIYATLGIAVFVALAIPARRRRRKKLATA